MHGRPSQEFISALKKAADDIGNGAHYEWGHMGSCNCGHVVQNLTKLSKDEIHRYAMEKVGDWTEQVQDFCADSGMPMDLLIAELLQHGITTQDLIELEKLSNPQVLEKIGKPALERNQRQSAVLYMKNWAALLEEEMV
jgi:hypothetical protein